MRLPSGSDDSRERRRNKNKNNLPFLLVTLGFVSVALLWWFSTAEAPGPQVVLAPQRPNPRRESEEVQGGHESHESQQAQLAQQTQQEQQVQLVQQVQQKLQVEDRPSVFEVFDEYVCQSGEATECGEKVCKVDEEEYRTMPWSSTNEPYEKFYEYNNDTKSYDLTLVRWDEKGDNTGQLAKFNRLLYDAPDPSLCGNPLCRLGPPGDGGWAACIDRSHLQNRECVIYSIGINNQPVFSVASAALGCDVFMFDHTVSRDTRSVLENLHHRLHFYPIGLGSESKGRLMSLPDMMKKHKHSYIDVLKIDCEGCEWEVFDSFAESNPDFLDKVGQILLEIHIHPHFQLKNINSVTNFVDHVLEKHGFRIAYRHLNVWSIHGGYHYREMFPDKNIAEGQENVSDFAFWELVLVRGGAKE